MSILKSYVNMSRLVLNHNMMKYSKIWTNGTKKVLTTTTKLFLGPLWQASGQKPKLHSKIQFKRILFFSDSFFAGAEWSLIPCIFSPMFIFSSFWIDVEKISSLSRISYFWGGFKTRSSLLVSINFFPEGSMLDQDAKWFTYRMLGKKSVKFPL